jgi:hypothetical protein
MKFHIISVVFAHGQDIPGCQGKQLLWSLHLDYEDLNLKSYTKQLQISPNLKDRKIYLQAPVHYKFETVLLKCFSWLPIRYLVKDIFQQGS